jgi:hypothetical protein
MPAVSEADLGNVGVQRGVVRYERVSRFTDPPGSETWLAMLDCGHEVKLDGEPPGGVGSASPGRYRDCPTCTAAR